MAMKKIFKKGKNCFKYFKIFSKHFENIFKNIYKKISKLFK